MAVLGWALLVLIAAGVSLAVYAALLFSGGRFDAETLCLLALAVALWVAVVQCLPFGLVREVA